jgi:hypothetical protein
MLLSSAGSKSLAARATQVTGIGFLFRESEWESDACGGLAIVEPTNKIENPFIKDDGICLSMQPIACYFLA